MLSVRSPSVGGRDIPDLIRYQLWDGPHAGEPITERAEIERLARECQAADRHACLDWTVIETRFNVVRSTVPETVTTARRLRDYLRPEGRRDPATQADGSWLGRAGRVGGGPAPWWTVARAWLVPHRRGVDAA
jgi:hypothetical protein